MHLHELLDEQIESFEEERERIHTLLFKTLLRVGFYEQRCLLCDLLEAGFLNSPARGTSLSIKDFFNRYKKYWKNNTVEGLLFYCEMVDNVLRSLSECEVEVAGEKEVAQIVMQIDRNLIFILDKLGYESKVGPGDIQMVVKKNPLAEEAIESVNDKDSAMAVLEYNHFALKGNIEKKRQLIQLISNVVEPLLKDKIFCSKCREIADDIGFALNNLNIRHNNVDGKNAHPKIMKHAERMSLESIYDDVYHSMLLLLEIKRQEEIHQRLKELRDVEKRNLIHD